MVGGRSKTEREQKGRPREPNELRPFSLQVTQASPAVSFLEKPGYCGIDRLRPELRCNFLPSHSEEPQVIDLVRVECSSHSPAVEGVAVPCSGSFNLRLTLGCGKLGFVPLMWKAGPIYNVLAALSVISMQWRESPRRNKSSKGTR